MRIFVNKNFFTKMARKGRNNSIKLGEKVKDVIGILHEWMKVG